MKLYEYSGFSAPKLLADNVHDFLKDLKETSTTVTSNYIGDLSGQIIEDIEFILNLDKAFNKDDINDCLVPGIWCDPSIEDFKAFNISVGLSEDMYLKDFIN